MLAHLDPEAALIGFIVLQNLLWTQRSVQPSFFCLVHILSLFLCCSLFSLSPVCYPQFALSLCICSHNLMKGSSRISFTKRWTGYRSPGSGRSLCSTPALDCSAAPLFSRDIYMMLFFYQETSGKNSFALIVVFKWYHFQIPPCSFPPQSDIL